MRYKYLIFDLDNTLYSDKTGMLTEIDRSIDTYIERKFSLPQTEITALRLNYWREFGTTLGGLVKNQQIDPEEYIQFAYQVKVEQFLHYDPRLFQLLQEIKIPKVIMSNSPREYIERVLHVLGVRLFFEKIYDIRFAKYLGKPNPCSYQRVLGNLQVDGEETMLIDDISVNLQTARELKITPVRVNPSPTTDDEDFPTIREIYDLKVLFPSLLSQS